MCNANNLFAEQAVLLRQLPEGPEKKAVVWCFSSSFLKNPIRLFGVKLPWKTAQGLQPALAPGVSIVVHRISKPRPPRGKLFLGWKNSHPNFGKGCVKSHPLLWQERRRGGYWCILAFGGPRCV